MVSRTLHRDIGLYVFGVFRLPLGRRSFLDSAGMPSCSYLDWRMHLILENDILESVDMKQV